MLMRLDSRGLISWDGFNGTATNHWNCVLELYIWGPNHPGYLILRMGLKKYRKSTKSKKHVPEKHEFYIFLCVFNQGKCELGTRVSGDHTKILLLWTHVK